MLPQWYEGPVRLRNITVAGNTELHIEDSVITGHGSICASDSVKVHISNSIIGISEDANGAAGLYVSDDAQLNIRDMRGTYACCRAHCSWR